MKFYLTMLFMFALVACGSNPKRQITIQQEIDEHEVKSLQDLNIHAQHLLEQHPELSPESKAKLTLYISETMSRLQGLKDEESKIVQSLLNSSIKSNETSNTQKITPKELKIHLNGIYHSKYENILSLIDHINEMSQKEEIDQRFTRDAQVFMREFR
jgi:hypothetical protein